MAWGSQDQNPSMSPSAAYGGTNYAASLAQAATYNPLGGGSSSTGMAPSIAGGGAAPSFADRLGAAKGDAAAEPPKTVSRALEWSSGQQPATASRAAREIQPWGGGGSRFEIAGKAAAPGRVDKANEALVDIMQKAAAESNYNVQMFSGYRPGDRRQHGRGNAVDIALVDPYSGEALANYQSGETFPQYETFAKRAYEIAQRDYPDLADDFRWGGYFGGGKRKYGAVDAMHFDVNSGMGMAGGSFEEGLTDRQQRVVDRMGAGRTQWAGLRPGQTAAPPTMYAGNPLSVTGAQGADTVAGGTSVPSPRQRPQRTDVSTAYAPSPEEMDQAPFDAVLSGAQDRRPQAPTPPANPRRDRLQATAPAPQGGAYVVRRGDNLSRIARQHGVSVEDIARANGIRDVNRIGEGQRLVIPGQAALPAAAPPPERQPANVPQPRPRPAREVAMPTPPARPDMRMERQRGGAPAAGGVPAPRPRPQPAASTPAPSGNTIRSEADIRQSVDAYRADAIRMGAPEGPGLDRAVQTYERSLRQQSGIRPTMDAADIGRSVSDHREYLLQQGIPPGRRLDEAVSNYERRLRERAAGGGQAPVSQNEPAGGMDTSGLIREPSAEERAIQGGARMPLPTGNQPIDPRNAARMDMADGVYRPIAEPGGPPWVASNGIRFYAVR